ncbi:hypothetical protein N7499_002742 [Penicillium canescens]|nr:hypothetical protein N7499_002742 [Penicillium canescens]KAJ6166357.1 hypothetical protein N7485_009601 [Penicillium canescens]
MSIALELGLHRHNPSWSFSPEEIEIRSRTWWTVYSLESRFIALNTGRVLSVRDQAIDTAIPSLSSVDQLTDHEAKTATLFHTRSVWLFVRMIDLRKIAGRILESIYIARDRDGRCSSLTFQEVCSISDDLHRQMDHWKIQLDAADIGSLRAGKLMRIEYCTMLMHLNRPSPAFMVPSQNMVAVCSHASSSALHQWAAMASESGIDSICRCYRHLHDILMAGLVRLYSDWHIQRFAPTSRSIIRPEDAAICLDLLSKGIANLHDHSLSRFQLMFSNLREKVYASKYGFDGVNQGISFSQTTEMPTFAGPPDIMGGGGDTEYVPNTDMDIMALNSEGLEGYLSQMSTIFGNEMLDIDDTLTAWYGSVLNDIGDTENMRTG